MTIRQAQDQVDAWIKTTGVRYFGELTNMTILMEEVGELARHMARTYGEQSYKEGEVSPQPNLSPLNGGGQGPIEDEMADILWVLICLANQTGVDLTEALKKNFEKKSARDKDRHQSNPKLK
jgi:NTP pyrophosphatase (non-canonical NTP hydrolase)